MADVSLNLRLLSLRNYYDKEGKIRHHSAAGGRRSPSWRETDSMQAQRRKSVGDSPPLSLADLNWNSNSLYRSKRSPILAEGILKSKPELLDSSYLYKDYREYDKGFTNLMQEPRARSASPLRALHHYELGSSLLTNGIYDYGKSTSPPIRRKHSMARILSGHQKNEQSTLASSLGGLTEKELRASLSESARKRAELINRLRTAHGMLEEQSELIRTRQSDLDINKTKIELLSLKQKQMEESVGRLEKEKEELELSRHEDIKQRGQLQDKISQLENEVAKTRSSLEKLTRSTFVPFATQRASFPKTEEDALKQGSDSLKRESQAVREALNIYKEHAENLVRERDKAVEELQSFKQEHHLLFTQTNEANQRATDSIRAQSELYDELVDLRGKYSEVSLEKDLLSSKVIRLEENVADLRMNLTAAISDKDRILQEKLGLNQQVQQLSLELERAQRGREGFNNQVSDLHIQLVSAKAQVNREDQEKILMKEELITVKQVNDSLTFELGQVCHKLENAMEQLHHLEAEKKILTNQVEALEMERAELLGEKEMLMSSVKIDTRSQEGESQALQEMCDELRASLETLAMENSTLKARNQEVESQFRQREEQLSSMLEEHQRVAQHWKERWQESAVTLKLKEEELQQITLQFQNAQEKNTELLGDCALFQVELEELAELKTTVKRLHGERQHLMEKQKENGQDVHQLQLQRSITTGSPQHEEYLEKFSSERNICHGELQQNHDRINELGRQNTETEAELKKLKEENAAVLRVRVELDVCRQELELERSRSKSLQQQVHQLQMKCQAKLPRRLSRSRSMVVQFEHESPVSPLQERCFSSGDAIQLFEINSSESEGICDVIDCMPTERHTEGLEKQKLLLQIDALNEELVEMRCTRQKHEAIIQSLKEELEEVKLEKPNEIKASLEEVDSELFQVREELQKVWDMLKRRDTELEEQYLELESARDQFSECSTEKQRLASMVSSLEQQLSEKEQTLRHVERIHETEKTELEIKISSLELKLAEMEILGGKIKNETASQEKCFTPSSLLKRMDSTLKDEAKKTIKKQQEQNEALTSPSSSQEGVSERAHLEEWGRRSPYGENDNLKHQQRLVTEQLKTLFREREQMAKTSKQLPHTEKREDSADEQTARSQAIKNVMEISESCNNSQESLEESSAMKKDTKFEEHKQEQDDPEYLKQELTEKTNMMFAMSNEIKVLKEKNDNLMKAKLRFQQQIQAIRNLPQKAKENDSRVVVPCFSSGLPSPLSSKSSSLKSQTPRDGIEESSVTSKDELPLLTPVEGSEKEDKEQGLDLNTIDSSGCTSPRSDWAEREVLSTGSSAKMTPAHSRPATPVNISTAYPFRQINSASVSPLRRGFSSSTPDLSSLMPRSPTDGDFFPESSLTSKCALFSPRPYKPQKSRFFLKHSN